MRHSARLALPLLIAATVVPRADAAPPAMRQAVAIPGRLPLYLGVPEANIVSDVGPMVRDGYGHCSANHSVPRWFANFEPGTHRAIFIDAQDGCFGGGGGDWRV